MSAIIEYVAGPKDGLRLLIHNTNPPVVIHTRWNATKGKYVPEVLAKEVARPADMN